MEPLSPADRRFVSLWSVAATVMWLMIAGLFLAMCAMPAWAQAPACGPAPLMLGSLIDQGAVPIGGGIDQDGDYVQILDGPKGWIIVYTTPQGRTCIYTHGKGWQADKPVEGKPS